MRIFFLSHTQRCRNSIRGQNHSMKPPSDILLQCNGQYLRKYISSRKIHEIQDKYYKNWRRQTNSRGSRVANPLFSSSMELSARSLACSGLSDLLKMLQNTLLCLWKALSCPCSHRLPTFRPVSFPLYPPNWRLTLGVIDLQFQQTMPPPRVFLNYSFFFETHKWLKLVEKIPSLRLSMAAHRQVSQ